MRITAIAMILALAGCEGQSSDNTNHQDASRQTIDLINSGDAASCSQEDVRNLILSKIKPRDSDSGIFDLEDFSAGQNLISYNVDTVALAGKDRSINSLSCDANVVIHYKDHNDKSFSIRYVLRPSVEDPTGFIINITAQDAAEYARNAALDAAAALEANRQKDAAPAIAESPSADSVAPPEQKNISEEGVDQEPQPQGQVNSPSPSTGASPPP